MQLMKTEDVEALKALREALDKIIPVFENPNATENEAAEALGHFIVAVARVTQ